MTGGTMDRTAEPRSVMIVDDDAGTRLLLAAELEAAGYRPILADSAGDAITRLHAGRCRVVITDWCMPEMDGLELCRRIRAVPDLSATHVTMITVNNDRSRLIEAFEAGVDDFLSKPIEPGVLMARMRAACRAVDLQDALFKRNQELEAANRRLLELATTDDLTGLANRRHGLQCLEQRWLESQRHGTPLAIAIVDIDRFKQLNDTYGHSVGDRALNSIAGVLRSECRGSDPVCRYGGEEFLIVLPNTDCASASRLALRWKEQVGAHRFVEGGLCLGATISIGIAHRTEEHRGSADLVRAADDALYAAKQSGRNAIRSAA
jgi:diguanylate cyclase (GGDEF)-like protein